MTMRGALLMVWVLVAGLFPLPALAQDATPEALGEGIMILPPDAVVSGQTVHEWAAAWWEYSEGPEADECQPGTGGAEVWFLPAVASNAPDPSDLQFTCEMPPGATIFYAIITGAGATAESCQTSLEEYLTSVGGLEAVTVEIDGHAVPDLERFALTPEPLPSASTPPGSPVATPGGADVPVTCGYGFLLAPLPPGAHEAQLRVEDEGEVVLGITQEITVEEAG